MSRNSKARRRTPRRDPKVLIRQEMAASRQSARMRVAGAMKRYARLDEHDEPVRCAGFPTGPKIVFDTRGLAEACRRSLVTRGLSEVRSVHPCRRGEGETHYHLTRKT